MKTEKQIEDKINQEGCEIQGCPVCKGENVDWGLLESDTCPSRDCLCKNCGASWVEVYEWHSIDNLKRG